MESSLLHVLVILSLDEDEVVSTKARETLMYLLDQPYPRGNNILQNLEESFFHALEGVHSAMNSARKQDCTRVSIHKTTVLSTNILLPYFQMKIY